MSLRARAGFLSGPALGTLLALGACAGSTEPEVGLWEATLSPVPPSTVSGSGAVVAQAGRTLVSIQIRGATPGTVYGWRLSQGTCASEGAIVGGAALYPALTPDASRGAGTDAALPGQISRSGTWAMRAFTVRSGGGEQVVACGAMEPAE